MSKNMVERVARAICESVESDDFDALGQNSVFRAVYVQQARHAIEAMREPSAWMIDEMCGAWARHPDDQRKLGLIMLDYWLAAIDAAFDDVQGNPETQTMITTALKP